MKKVGDTCTLIATGGNTESAMFCISRALYLSPCYFIWFLGRIYICENEFDVFLVYLCGSVSGHRFCVYLPILSLCIVVFKSSGVNRPEEKGGLWCVFRAKSLVLR